MIYVEGEEQRESEGEVDDTGEEFEEEIRNFIKKLGFEDVKGGKNFHIAPKGKDNQIDACGKFQKKLFVIECTAARKKHATSLHNKILNWKHKISLVEQNYKDIPEYKDCTAVIPIFATRKYVLGDADKALLNDEVHSKYIDEEFLNYYNDLVGKIGKFAIYSFMYELGISAGKEDTIHALAIKNNIRGYQCFTFFIDPKELLKFAYVARRGHLIEDYYQRNLDNSRLNEIATFIEAEENIFLNNIIIGFPKPDKEFYSNFYASKCIKDELYGLPKDSEVGILRIGGQYGSCWIIDGQHRLYGFAKTKGSFLVPCIAIEKVDIQKQRKFFVDINDKQKRVSPDLVWDLKGDMDGECKSDDGLISNAVKMIDDGCRFNGVRSEKSPFIEKIKMPSKPSEGRTIKISAFCLAIKNAKLTKEYFPEIYQIRNPLFVEIRSTFRNRIATTLSRYFDVLNNEIGDEDIKRFVFGNAGVPIALYIFEAILAYIHRIPNRSDLEPFCKKIGEYFETTYNTKEKIKKLRASTTGEGGRREEARNIGRFIRSDPKYNNFWPTLEFSELSLRAAKAERLLAKLISNELSKVDTNWMKSRVNVNDRKMIEHEMEEKNKSFEDSLGFGVEKNIIRASNNWNEVFKPIFIGYGKYRDEKEFEVAIEKLGDARAPRAHQTKSTLTRNQDKVTEGYLNIMYEIFEEMGIETEEDEEDKELAEEDSLLNE
ncbi:MAG: DGQHR domain-containing protein [Candidatus Parvarchaeota archaeon]